MLIDWDNFGFIYDSINYIWQEPRSQRALKSLCFSEEGGGGYLSVINIAPFSIPK